MYSGDGMDLINLYYQHRSIRIFQDRELPWERLNELIKASIHGTSSSGNLNAYSIIVSRKKEARERLWEIHGEQDFIKQAPCTLTFLADYHRTRLWLKEQGAQDGFDDFLCFLVAAFDAVLLSQSLALACEAEGWGICYMGTTLFAMAELKEFLRLPPTVVPVTSMVIGYPAENPAARSRLPLEAYIHDEYYHEYDDADLQRLYSQRNKDFTVRYGTNSEILKEFSRHGIENLAQFYTSPLKYFPPSMRDYAEKIREYLHSNDFDRRD
jgi:nitroreductase